MKKCFLLVIVLVISIPAYSENYWAVGTITEYHVTGESVLVEMNNSDDPKCQGYNWYGDYIIQFPDPAADPAKAMMASHKVQVLFDHFKNNRPIKLYVSESNGYCNINTVTYDGGS